MTRGSLLGISVGRRIAILIVAEAILLGVLVASTFHVLSRLASDLEYSRRFTLAPTDALPHAIEQAAAMKGELEPPGPDEELPRIDVLEHHLGEIAAVIHRYEVEWKTADSSTEDAQRYRDELAEVNQLSLIDDERAAVGLIRENVRRLEDELRYTLTPEGRERALRDVQETQRGLRSLLRTNIHFLNVDHSIQERRTKQLLGRLVALGLGGLVLTILLGLRVRHAIGPRLAAMTRKVRVFQETGDFTRTADPGSDEITVLANALDVGFAAIRERERERELFMGVVAHELKTPLTSIVGYAEAALERPDATLRGRALEVVFQQAKRLNRLVQDLLWAASLKQGILPFEPTPTGIRALVRKALTEVANRQRFVLDEGEELFFLADEKLVVHALWQALSYASVVTAKGELLPIHIGRREARLEVRIELRRVTISSEELERAFLPFANIQYEGAGLRYAVGLYLGREIARLHGGTLRASSDSSTEATLLLEFPA